LCNISQGLKEPEAVFKPSGNILQQLNNIIKTKNLKKNNNN
jgi:hypothetical protein